MHCYPTLPHLNSDDGTLSMKKQGTDYCVKFVRFKEQTQYAWKQTEWRLVVYKDVMESEDVSEEVLQRWKIQRKESDYEPIKFKKAKTEIEVHV